MISLGRSKKVPQKLWRPDFRDTQTLPDTKVIRTGFLLNFIAIAIALAALSAYLVKEYNLQGLIREVNKLTVQVDGNQSLNRSILDVNKKFRQNAAVVEEAIAFDFQPVPLSDLIAELSGSLQEGMLLKSIQIKYGDDSPDSNSGVSMLAIMAGRVLEEAPGTPAEILDNFQNAIRELPLLGERTVNMDMMNFGRDNEFGYFDFTLSVEIQMEKPAAL
jgi:hypothetical protein